MIKLVAYDCDGVLADFCSAVLSTVGSPLSADDVNTWDIFALLGDKAGEAKRALKDPDWWAALPPYPGALAHLDRDRSAGAEIVIATSPWLSCVGWETARREWLMRHFDILPEQVLIGAPKHAISCDVLIEDKPETLLRWSDRHPRSIPVLIDRPYNRDAIGLHRVHDWPRRGWRE